MKKIKKIASSLCALLLAAAMPVTALAAELPDAERTGSISVTMKSEGKTISGGSMVIYRVGQIFVDDADYSFVYTEEWKECKSDLSNIQSSVLAEELAEYAETKNIKGDTEKIDENGNVKFEDLKTGLYLLVQKEAAEGYKVINPFLVSLPIKDGDSWIYDIDATPKAEENEPAEPDGPTTPDEPDGPTTPDEPDGPTTPDEPDGPTTPDKPDETTPSTPEGSGLPQTGQLNWPIPILAAAGLALFAWGWFLYFVKKDK